MTLACVITAWFIFDMNSKEKKNALRRELLKKREAIGETSFLKKSEQICQQLQQRAEFLQAQTIHCYVSMNDRREVNTHGLIKTMLKAGKHVVVPVTDFDTTRMNHILLKGFDQLKKNKWDVLEPYDGRPVPVNELELVVVPMVGGDHQKNRIGYGKGFYDRFLSQVQCPKIGLLFEECLLYEIPVEPFDVSLSTLITEERVI